MHHLTATRVAWRPLAAAMIAVGLCAFSTSHAASFDWGNGVTGSFDSTISIGGLWRVSGRDPALIGTVLALPGGLEMAQQEALRTWLIADRPPRYALEALASAFHKRPCHRAAGNTGRNRAAATR